MNRGSDSILSVYSDARAEYTKQLCVFLVPAYFQFFTELLEKSKRDMVNEPRRVLWQFQTYLNEIHDWNMEKVNSEISRINTNCGCDYLDDLLTAVFIAHTKVLTAIRLSSNKKKIEINVPKVEHFLFKVLCETSKLLWSSTYLFRDGISGIEKQQNYRTIEQIINEGILQAVRSLVPVKSILRDFVNNDTPDENESDDEEETQPEESLQKSEELSHIQDEKILEVNQTTSDNTVLQDLKVEEQVEIKNEAIEPATSSVPSLITSSVPSLITSSVPSLITSSVPSLITSSVPSSVPQTIIIEDKPTVTFGNYDAVFDTENPLESEMVYDARDDEEDEVPALEILDEVGASLSEGLDFDSLDEQQEPDSLNTNDYEEL
jgi:hypothetical protein